MLKILQQYYSATKDERVIAFMTKYFKYQLQELPKKPLGKWTFWAQQRGGDNLLIVYWLYNIRGMIFYSNLEICFINSQQTGLIYLTMTTIFTDNKVYIV